MIVEALLITAPTMYLGYVTQFPYAIRRRHAAKVRYHAVTFYGTARHHGRLVLWQLTVLMPRRRRSIWRRGKDD